MANILHIPIPATKQQFYSNTTKPQNKAALDSIYATYQTEIDTAARLANVPQQIITSVIFIESAGNPNVVSGAGAIGLMQLMTSCGDILVIENMKKRFTQEEKDILTQYLGDRFTKGILKEAYLDMPVTVNGVTYDGVKTKIITKADLLKPALNVLIGALYLGILIDECSSGGKVNLHKVIVRYNKGYFADNKGKDIPDNINDALAATNTESKNYILKLMGSNGTLDSIPLPTA